MATELMPYSLQGIIEKDRKGLAPPEWTPTRRSCVAFAIAAGMDYLHSRNIVHRDLKPENVLLDEALLPRIADFGFAKWVSVSNQMEMTRGIGTPIYMAPELYSSYDEPDYTGKVDVFAFGILLFAMFTSQVPFSQYKNGGALRIAVANGERPECPDDLPPDVVGLMQRCWDASPERRPSFAEILEAPEGFLLSNSDEAAFKEFRKYLLVDKRMFLPV
jgi:serine/threonine protein kinase